LATAMQTYKTLSFGDKWRVARLLVRGEAPSDLRMAAAAVELAESYQGHGQIYAALARWLPFVMMVVFSAIAIPAAVNGDVAMTIGVAVLIVGSVGHLVFNPVLRPKNVARSRKDSQRVLASGA
jgi:site-specific recombinase